MRSVSCGLKLSHFDMHLDDTRLAEGKRGLLDTAILDDLHVDHVVEGGSSSVFCDM